MSAIGDAITRYVPIARRKPKIDRKDALAIVPVRNKLVEWERKDKEVVLTIRMRDGLLAKVAKKVVRNLPDSRQIALDDVGSSVWELCDGERDINGLVQAISSNYKLTRREAEASITMLLQTLAKKNLIGPMSLKRSERDGGKKSAKRKR
jgi:hypothetical protein